MQHLIFDFDGTIVNSGPLVYSCLSEYTNNCDYTWNQLRELPSNEVVNALGISRMDLPKLILKIRAAFKNKISEQPIVEGIVKTMTQLKENGFQLHVVSSNSKENIEQFLQMHGLSEAVASTTSFFTIFGKASGIKSTLSDHGIDSAHAIYIGDETRDIQAAEKAGIKSMSVCWGYNAKATLLTYKPDFIAETPQEMVDILCKDCG